MAGTSYFNIIPHSQWGQSSPSGVIAIGVPTGSSQYTTINGDVNGTGFPYDGKTYDLWNGPFSSEAEAKASVGGASGWSYAGVLGALALNEISKSTTGESASTGTATKAGASAGNAITSVTQFLQGLTSASLWIRVAKIVVGGALVIVGVAHLTGVDNKVISGATKALPLLAA